MTIFYFIIGLGLLIFIHELGHFLVAKANGIRVERFSLGFGPRLIKFTIGETEYCVSALPLGGYVKMTGQEDFGEEEKPMPEDPRAFSSKGLMARLSVVLAGPVMNLVLPFILMPLALMLGLSQPKFLRESPVIIGVQEDSPAQAAGIQVGDTLIAVDQNPVNTWEEYFRYAAQPGGAEIQLQWNRGASADVDAPSKGDPQTFEEKLTLEAKQAGAPGIAGIEPVLFMQPRPFIGEVSSGSPAESAGLQTGDLILSIDGEVTETWEAMSAKVMASEGNALNLEIKRDGEPQSLTLKPEFNEEFNKYTMGVSQGADPDLFEVVKYPFSEAVARSIPKNLSLYGMTFDVLGKLFTFQLSLKELGGPVRIAQVSAKAAEQGAGNFLFLLAFLSIQLGILNLLPIPVLDGGHVVFMLYEAVVGKPLPVSIRSAAQIVGLVLLLTLMLVVTFNDIDAVWGFKDIFQGIKGWFG